MKNFQNYLSTDIKSFKDTKIKKIKDNNEVENKIKDNKKLIKKKLIIGIFLAIIGLITFIMLIFFFLIDNNNYRGRGIYSNKISLSYEEAKSLLNFEVIENNDFLLNNISDGVNNSILICQQYNINDIPSEIIYNSPYFLENPTKTSLKIVKSDLDIYKGKYEELSKEINILGNTSILFFNNFSYSIEKMKDEVNKIIYQFKYVIKNISIPLIYMEKILKNNRMLNEDVENINNKLSLFTKIEEYKNETEKLNILYNKMFKYIEESVQLINNEIIEFSNSFIELQNEIEEGMSNFEQIIDNFENPDDILFFHENLKAMKTNFVSIKNELIIKKEMSENRIKKIENSYINERNKIKIEKIKEESNEILANLKIKSKSIKNDIIGELKKNYLNSVEIPELSASNIIFDLIDKTLNYSGFS